MKHKRLFALIIAPLLWSPAAAAADLETDSFHPFAWRDLVKLAKTPICDLFRGAGRISDVQFVKYGEMERKILSARAQVYARRADAGKYTEMLLPGDYMRACK